jgi:hypothetical protein
VAALLGGVPVHVGLGVRTGVGGHNKLLLFPQLPLGGMSTAMKLPPRGIECKSFDHT